MKGISEGTDPGYCLYAQKFLMFRNFFSESKKWRIEGVLNLPLKYFHFSYNLPSTCSGRVKLMIKSIGWVETLKKLELLLHSFISTECSLTPQPEEW